MNKTHARKVGFVLRMARLSAGIGQEDLAGRLGISQPTVSRWEHGRGLPDDCLQEQLLAQICSCTELRDVLESILEARDTEFDPLVEGRLNSLLNYFVMGARDSFDCAIPLYADIAAGAGEKQLELQEPVRTLQVPAEVLQRDPTAYAMRVVGDSMQPLIEHGDVLVVSPASAVVHGCVVAACVEPDGDVVKIYRELPAGHVELKSLNRGFPDFSLVPGSGRRAQIWGRVVMQLRDL